MDRYILLFICILFISRMYFSLFITLLIVISYNIVSFLFEKIPRVKDRISMLMLMYDETDYVDTWRVST